MLCTIPSIWRLEWFHDMLGAKYAIQLNANHQELPFRFCFFNDIQCTPLFYALISIWLLHFMHNPQRDRTTNVPTESDWNRVYLDHVDWSIPYFVISKDTRSSRNWISWSKICPWYQGNPVIIYMWFLLMCWIQLLRFYSTEVVASRHPPLSLLQTVLFFGIIIFGNVPCY